MAVLSCVQNIPVEPITNVSDITLSVYPIKSLECNYHSCILAKDHLIPAVQSYKLICLNPKPELTLMEPHVFKELAIKIAILGVLDSIVEGIRYVTSSTPINKAIPKTDSGLNTHSNIQVPDTSNSNKRKADSPNRAGKNPIPVSEAKRRRVAQQITIDLRYTGLLVRHSALLYDALDPSGTNMLLLFGLTPFFTGVYIYDNKTCILFNSMPTPNPLRYEELVHRGETGI